MTWVSMKTACLVSVHADAGLTLKKAIPATVVTPCFAIDASKSRGTVAKGVAMTERSLVVTLKPCPFCSGEAEIIGPMEDEGFGNDGAYAVECKRCQTASRLHFPNGEDPAPIVADLWNQRAGDETKELVSVLQDLIRWGDSHCPLADFDDDDPACPNPCPLCRASIEKGACMAAEKTIPKHILDNVRGALENCGDKS